MSTETKVTEIAGVTYTDTIVDDVLVSTTWVDADGTGTIARETDSNGDVTEVTTWTLTGNDNPTTSSNYVYDSDGNFLGGTKSENGVTYTYDSEWSVTGITFDLLLITDTSYTDNFGNASVVAELFGLNPSEIQFQITNTWQDESDPDQTGTDVSFFDADGTQLGFMYVNTNSWTDNGNKVLSTNIGFDSVDADGNRQWIGGSWENYDSQNTDDTSDDVLRDSGSNSRVTKTVSELDDAPAGLLVDSDDNDLSADAEVVVETGSNTWLDPQGEERTSYFTRYFLEDSDDPYGGMTFLGGQDTENGITRAYDGDWNQLGQPTADTSSLANIGDSSYTYGNASTVLEVFGGSDTTTSDILFKLVNSWQDENDPDQTGIDVSFFDADGTKLGAMHVNTGSWTDNGNKILSTNIGFNTVDANGNWQHLGGSWKNYDSQNTDDTSDDELRDSGSNSRVTKAVSELSDAPAGILVDGDGVALSDVTEVIVETGSNTWTDPQGNESTSLFTRYFIKGADNNQTFLGGQDTENGITRAYDGDWNQLGQPTADTSSLANIGDSAYTYGNASTVLEVFGGSDSTTSDILFKVVNTWQDESDPDQTGTDISFFDADGTQLGFMYVNTNSWTDNGNKVLSTNIGFDSVDADGNRQWIGGSWENYDSQNTDDTSDDVLRDSGSNSRVTKTVSELDDAPAGLLVDSDDNDLSADAEVVVETGSNTWLDPQGEERTSYFTRYFLEDSDDPYGGMTFLGGQDTENGITRAYDGDWNQLGQPTADTSSLANIGDSSYTYGNASTVLEVFGGSDTTTSDILFKLVNSWQDENDPDQTGIDVSFFDADGTKLGAMHVNTGSWTDNGNKILSTNIGFNTVDANGNWQHLGGSWKNYDSQNTDDTSDDELRDSGSNSRVTKAVSELSDAPAGILVDGDGVALSDVTEVIVETGSNTWTDPQGNESTSLFTRYFIKGADNNQTFLGGQDTENGITRAYDGDWNQLGQPTADTSSLANIGDSAYTYGNASTVLEVFGGSDSTTSDILFKVVNTWQDESDPDQTGTDISFFDADGTQLGFMYVNTNSWTDNGNKVLSTNIGFDSVDADGNRQWIGGSWENYDSQNTDDTSDDVLRDSGSNSRVTKTVSELDDAPAGLLVDSDDNDLSADAEVVVETGSNTWLDPQGEERTSYFTRYFLEDSDDPYGGMTFLGGQDTENGITRAYDGDWNQLGQPTADTSSLANIGDSSYTYGNASTVLEVFGGSDTTTSDILFKLVNSWQDENDPDQTGIDVSFFDADGTKLGAMHVNTGSWTDNGNKILSTNIGFNTVDANGNWQHLGGSWKNYDSQNTDDTSDDELRDSGSNSRVTKAVSELSDAPAGILVDGDGVALSDVTEVIVETGSNTWTDPQGNESTSLFTRYFIKGADNNQTFLGGQDTENGITRAYDGDWNQLGQPTADTSSLANIGDSAYTYGNASTVLEVFGGSDSTTSDILFKVVNTWQDESDPDQTGTDISFFDADGTQLGFMYVNTNSWTDNGNKVLSTNIGFDSVDADGNRQWIGGSWENYDSQNTDDTSDDVLRDSGSNSRVTKTVSELDDAPAGLLVDSDDNDLSADAEVVVETGSNTWLDPQGEERTSYFTRYFLEDSDDPYGGMTFLGGQDTENGITRAYDGDWNQLGQPTADTSSLANIGDSSYTYGNASTVLEVFGGSDTTTSDILFKLVNSWQDENDPDQTGIDVSFFDADGTKLGAMHVNTGSWTDNGNKILSTNIGFNTVDANGNWQHLGGSWKNYDSQNTDDTSDDELRDSGSNSRVTKAVSELSDAPAGILVDGDGVALSDVTEVIVETGSNTWTDPQGNESTSLFTRYFIKGADNNQTFLGGQDTENGITRAYDGDWNQLGQPTADTSSLANIGDSAYTYGNASTVLEVFGGSDSTTSDILFKVVNTWQDESDPDQTGTDISFFDADGTQLGFMYVNTNSWTDNGNKVLSTNIGFDSVDADGNRQWIGGSWENYDSQNTDDTSDDVLRDSGSNSRVTKTVSELDDAPAGLLVDSDDNDLSADAEVVVETGSNTWLDPQGEERTSYFTRYFLEDSDDPYGGMTFLGGQDTENGITRAYDGDWNQLGQPTADTSSLANIGDSSYTYGNASTVLEVFGGSDTTTSDILFKLVNSWQDENDPDQTGIDVSFFDADGTKLGAMHVNTGSWTDNGNKILSTNIGFNTVDANGNWQHLGGSWKNYDSQNTDDTSDDELRDSGSNSRVTKAVSELSDAPAGILVDGDGVALSDVTEVIVETGSNTWTDPQGNESTSLFTRYFIKGADNNQTFLGGQDTENGITRAYDGDWNQLGQPTADTSSLANIGDSAYTYGNASTVLEVFGGSDSTTSDILFKVVNTWQDESDPDQTGTDISFFDADGTQLGFMYVNTNSWTDNGNKVLSTNIGFDSVDADGNRQWIGGSWENYDSQNTDDTSDDVLRDSGSNSRVTKTVSELDDAPAGLLVDSDDNDLSADAEVVVETGSNTWLDPQGEERTSYFTRYFLEDSDDPYGGMTFLGGQDTENGITRAYDGDWNQLGQPTADTSSLANIGDSTYTYGNASTVLSLFGGSDTTTSDILFKLVNSWQDENDPDQAGKEIKFFDADGTQLGVMYVNTGSWTDNGNKILSTNIDFDKVDADGNLQRVGGSYKNYDSQNTDDTSDDVLRDSGSNSRVTKAVSELSDVPAGILVDGGGVALSDDTEVVVETGSNAMFDPQGNESTWSWTKYFETGDNGQFLGEIGVGDDGYTRVEDRFGNVSESGGSNNDDGNNDDGNNDPWLNIQTDNYSLDLPPESMSPPGWALGLNGTDGSDNLDLAEVAAEQDLLGTYNIDVNSIYTRLSERPGWK
jgi:hypothetical protein